MFKRHYQKRHTNIVFVIFRLCLSMVIFAVLLGGIYSAYKHFSGIDPLKIDPQALTSNLIKSKSPKEFLSYLSSLSSLSNLGGVGATLGVKTAKETQTSPSLPDKQAPVSFSLLLISDSHSESDYLNKAIAQAKEKGNLKFIIGLGDYTEIGATQELANIKNVLDLSSLRYFLTPGDHDLWDSRDKNLPAEENFTKIFGPAYQSFVYNNIRFLLVNNADNYVGLDNTQLAWITTELEQAKKEGNIAVYAFMHEPLHHPSSDHIMGAVNKDLSKQARNLIFTLKDGGVKEIFSGHVHFFSRYKEPESNLPMTVIGALTTKNNAQAPRYTIVNIFSDGSLDVEDVEVKKMWK